MNRLRAHISRTRCSVFPFPRRHRIIGVFLVLSVGAGAAVTILWFAQRAPLTSAASLTINSHGADAAITSSSTRALKEPPIRSVGRQTPQPTKTMPLGAPLAVRISDAADFLFASTSSSRAKPHTAQREVVFRAALGMAEIEEIVAKALRESQNFPALTVTGEVDFSNATVKGIPQQIVREIREVASPLSFPVRQTTPSLPTIQALPVVGFTGGVSNNWSVGKDLAVLEGATIGAGVGALGAFTVKNPAVFEKSLTLNSASSQLSVAGNIAATGRILIADGTAAAPSIAFSDDTDTGMFRTSANIIGFSTNGIEHARVNTSGVNITGTNIAIYVDATSGNDSNDGLTASTAKRTIQAAINQIPLVTSGIFTINIANGTYTEKLTIPAIIAKQGDSTLGSVVIKLQGNATDASQVVLDCTGTGSGNDCITHRNNGLVVLWVSGIRFTNANRVLTLDNATAFFNTTTADNVAGVSFQVSNGSVLTFLTGGSTVVTGTAATGNRFASLSNFSRVVQNHSITAASLGTLGIEVGEFCSYGAASNVTLSLTKGGAAPTSEDASFGIRVRGLLTLPTSTTTIDNFGSGIITILQGMISLNANAIAIINNAATGWRLTGNGFLTQGNAGNFSYTNVTTKVKVEEGAVLATVDQLDGTPVTLSQNSFFGSNYVAGYDFRYGRLASSTNTWTTSSTFRNADVYLTDDTNTTTLSMSATTTIHGTVGAQNSGNSALVINSETDLTGGGAASTLAGILRLRENGTDMLTITSTSTDRLFFISHVASSTAYSNVHAFVFDTVNSFASHTGVSVTDAPQILSVRNAGTRVFSVTAGGNAIASGSFISSGSPGDVAEYVEVVESVEEGDVLVVADKHTYRKSSKANDARVAGVFAATPKFIIGSPGSGKAPLALAGIVQVKVTDEAGPIAAGDILVTASTPGHAMRFDPSKNTQGMVGVLGVALESFLAQTDADKTKTYAEESRKEKIMALVKTGWVNSHTETLNSLTSDVTALGGVLGVPIRTSQAPLLTASESQTGALTPHSHQSAPFATLAHTQGALIIDADGTLTVKSLDATRVVASQFAVKAAGDARARTIGEATIPQGERSVRVENMQVTPHSKIFITFRANPGSNWWVGEIGNGSFDVLLAFAAPTPLVFDFWIVETIEASPLIPQEAPQESTQSVLREFSSETNNASPTHEVLAPERKAQESVEPPIDNLSITQDTPMLAHEAVASSPQEQQ